MRTLGKFLLAFLCLWSPGTTQIANAGWPSRIQQFVQCHSTPPPFFIHFLPLFSLSFPLCSLELLVHDKQSLLLCLPLLPWILTLPPAANWKQALSSTTLSHKAISRQFFLRELAYWAGVRVRESRFTILLIPTPLPSPPHTAFSKPGVGKHLLSNTR